MAAFKIKNENGEIIEVPAIMGLSAYQIALENGFEGTEQEWLESLKGEPGSTEGLASEEYVQTEIQKYLTIDSEVPV